MIHLDITLEDVDYESLLRAISGTTSSSGGILGGAAVLLKHIPQNKRDRFAAGLITKNSDSLSIKLEEIALQNGIKGKITKISART